MKFYTSLDLNSANRVINMQDPVSAQDAATKAYVDSAVEGLAWKDSVRVASTANVNLSSPGTSIDGVTLSNNDRVLLKDQTTASGNGIYIFNGSAVAMTRAADASTFDELEQATTTVEEGTSAGTTYRQTAINGTLGSTSIVWTTFGTSAPSASETTAGIIEIATQAETDTGTDDVRAITPLKLKNWSLRAKRYSADVGDGTQTSYTITHNLGTRDVIVQVYRNSGSYDQVIVDIGNTTTNTVTITFSTAPASAAYRVVVIA